MEVSLVLLIEEKITVTFVISIRMNIIFTYYLTIQFKFYCLFVKLIILLISKNINKNRNYSLIKRKLKNIVTLFHQILK